jgi:hypothetical protein
MAAYFTRSVVRPPGFYRALNNRSSLDAESIDKPTTSSFTSLSEREIHEDDVYEVERLVQRRNSKGEAEYLVLWAGYRKEDASWVKEHFITRPALE